MKKYILLITLFLGLSISQAQTVTNDVATVVSVQPRYVTIQQQQCEQRQVSRDNSSQDGTIGALAGAALGSTVGGNNKDRLAGGVIGALVGGAIGNNIGKENQQLEYRNICRYVPVTVQQGSIVTFSYRGQIFSQQFAQ